MFAAIRAGDILVHHPYESFAASVERFITQAADDPDVLTIKMTLYRTSGDSPIVQSLIRAAERGKQVVVLVEIKARFDEEANIIWARKLERAGAHVVYGLVGLKTHSKTALVVRREGSGLRRYVHIGTGNYNPKTARLYVDLGLLTARPEIGADVTDLFNVLTGLSRQRTFRRLLVAPHSLRSGFLDARRSRGRPTPRPGDRHGSSSSSTRSSTRRSSRRSIARRQAGVDIDLIVRGACSLAAGRARASRSGSASARSSASSSSTPGSGASRTAATREWYIGSADLMDRNLDRRVEAVVPVEDSEAKARIAEIIELMLADDRRSWQLQPDASWVRTEVLEGRPGTIDTFEVLKERALTSGARGGGAAPPGFRSRLAGPARVTAEGIRPMEVELKYRVGELAAAERLLAADRVGPFAVTGGRARSTQLEDRYVDTADGALGRAGFAVRLRQSGGETIVSVKSLARTDGPGRLRAPRGARRARRIASRAAVDWPASDARALVLEHAGDAPLVERRDRPPAPAQATAEVGPEPGRAQPRRGRRREPRPRSSTASSSSRPS